MQINVYDHSMIVKIISYASTQTTINYHVKVVVYNN